MDVNAKYQYGFVLVALITCSVIFAIVVDYLQAEKAQTSTKTKSCMRPECVVFAGYCLQSMDFLKDPCQSFYSFVCGKYSYKHPKPENEDSITEHTIIFQKVEYSMRQIVRQPILKSDPRYLKIFKRYYRACIDTKTIEKNALMRAKQIINELGGWPVIEDLEPDLTWDQVQQRIYDLGFKGNYLFNLLVAPSLDIANYTLFLDPAPTTVGYISEGSGRYDLYHEFMVNMSKKFGADNSGDMLEALKFHVKFYQQLIKFAKSSQIRNISSAFKLYTLKELCEEFPNIPWLQYLTGAIQNVVNLTSDQQIYVLFPIYLTSLPQILNETKPSIVRNYLVFKALEELMPYLSRDIEDVWIRFEEAFLGKTIESLPRWTKCLRTTIERFGIIATSSYVRRYFKRSSKLAAEKFVASIKSGFIDIVNNTNWAEEDKLQASEKLLNMHEVTGYPVELLNDTVIDDYYKLLEINRGDYASVELNVTKFIRISQLSMLSKRMERNNWRYQGDLIKIWPNNKVKINILVISATIFNGMYYNRNVPNYINLATLGKHLAASMSNAITGVGKQFGKNGGIADIKQSNDNFNETRWCLAEMFQKFYGPRIINSHDTFVTNVEDLAGWTIAYNIYRKLQRSNEPEQSLPGLNFTKNQMFWIAATATECASSKTNYADNLLTKQFIVPNEFRVDGTLRNIEDFAKDFSCPKGSFMNPEVKCGIF